MYNKNAFLMISLLIGLCFFGTGTGYLTWLYRLSDFCSASRVDILTEVVGYIFQAAGLISGVLLIKKKISVVENKYFYLTVLFFDILFISMGALSWNMGSCLLFGYAMNFMHGIVATIYLLFLVKKVSSPYRGRAFGIGYAFGSVSTYLLSIVNSSNFLRNNLVLIVYVIAALLSVPLFLACSHEKTRETDLGENRKQRDNGIFSSRFILGTVMLALMLSTIKNLGFYFPSADLSGSGVSLEFSRLFYAAGLVIAGFVSDYSRKYGSICCVAALVFPFVTLALLSQVTVSMVFWITNYFFTGFFVVYRVILFADIAELSDKLIFLSGFGLLFGRIGDAIGALAGILLKDNVIILVVGASTLFIITIFLFFKVFQKLYLTDNSIKRKNKDILSAIAEKYELTPREADLLVLLGKNYSNAEIAAELFISENTVKFHMKNLLKKTGCSNRTEIMSMLK